MRSNGKYSILFLIAGLAVLFFILAILSTGTEGGADDYVHYGMARYAFEHPQLFLDHWGKPIFTLLSSPFAQMGFIGMKVFNILIGSLTAYFLYLILKIRNNTLAVIAPVFLFFAPIYTVLLLSGMTEIFFAFLFTLTIYLFFKEKYIPAAIVASFLPIARTESIILIPFIIVALSWRRQWISLPFILTAFCLYGLIGWKFLYHDFFWLIHQNPYKYKEPLYGSGELLHFVKNLKNITGLPLLILSLPGFVLSFYNLFKKGIKLQNPESEEILLIVFPLVTYFAAHSYIWWKGIGASIGLIRVMTCIMPLWVFYSVKGLESFTSIFKESRIVKFILVIASLYFVIVTPFKVFSIPIHRLPTHEVTKKATDWMLANELTRHIIFYYEPYLTTVLGIDPYDQKLCHAFVFDNKKPSSGLPDSAVLVWDAQFSPNEGGLPLGNIMSDPQMKLLKVFRPDIPFTVLGGHPYEIYIFLKVESNLQDNYVVAGRLSKEMISGNEREILYHSDFENFNERIGYKTDSMLSVSGRYSVMLDTINEFSLTFQHDCKLFTKAKKAILYISVYCNPVSIADKSTLLLVSSFEENGKIYDYHAADIKNLSPEAGKWTALALEYNLPGIKSATDIFKVYLWRQGKFSALIDDYTIELIIEDPRSKL